MRWIPFRLRAPDLPRLRFVGAGGTSVGRRDNNEDSWASRDDLGLYVVADGMGGYEGGEEASRASVDALVALYERTSLDQDATWPFKRDPALSYEESRLVVGIRQAHCAIEARRTPRLAQMGSTVVVLVARQDGVVVGHVGDSRVYRLRGRALTALTVDHSLYEEYRRSSEGPIDRHRFAWSNVVTRALGTDKHLPDVEVLDAEVGDRFLLCSDGLVEKLEDEEVGRLLATGGPSDAVRALLAAAEAVGTRDNTTVVVVDALRWD